MYILDQDSLVSLLTSCADGNAKIASIIFRDRRNLEVYRDSIVECFMQNGINGVDTIKQCFSIDDIGEVDCIVFNNGSLVFLYALPDENKIPRNQAMICIPGDGLFDIDTITEASQHLDVVERLRKITGNQTATEPKKRRTRKKEPEVDPLDEWINSLKVIN